MLGNDVVDLRDPECLGGRHPRFDDRVFRAEERAGLATGGDDLRFTLWAAKESAFKAARRRDSSVIFSPRRFAVELAGEDSGSVRRGGDRLDLRVFRGDGFVHAVSTFDGGADRPLRGVAALSAEEAADAAAPGRAARALATSHIAARLRVPPRELEVRRRNRLPEVWLRGAPLAAVLSLSHHGRFVAFACALLPQGAEPS